MKVLFKAYEAARQGAWESMSDKRANCAALRSLYSDFQKELYKFATLLKSIWVNNLELSVPWEDPNEDAFLHRRNDAMQTLCRNQARLLQISREWPELGRAEGIEKTYLRYCQEYKTICEFRSLHTATLMIIEKAYTKAYGTNALPAAAEEASEDMEKETESDSDSDVNSNTSEAKSMEVATLAFDKLERKRLAMEREKEHEEEKLKLEKKRLREDERERRMQRKARYKDDEKDRRRLMKARYKEDDASRKRLRKDRG